MYYSSIIEIVHKWYNKRISLEIGKKDLCSVEDKDVSEQLNMGVTNIASRKKIPSPKQCF